MADAVEWANYFNSISDVCPWSKAYWRQKKIDICVWNNRIDPLGDYAARVYVYSDATAHQLESIMEEKNVERPDEEWLFSHPDFGNNSTPVPVLIQQDHHMLTKIRETLNE